MNYEPDDPQLTAYALNELDEAAAREIEAHLTEDPEARRMVEEIRATSALLTTELKKESAPKLHAGQRATIQSVARVGVRKVGSLPATPLHRYRPFIAAAAALFVLGVTMFWVARTEHYNAPKSVGYATSPKAEAESKNQPASAHSSDVSVPPAVLEKSRLGDHYETKNLDESEAHIRLGYVDAPRAKTNEAGGGGAEGTELHDTSGVGGIALPNSSGGWIAGDSEKEKNGRSQFGNREKKTESKKPLPISESSVSETPVIRFQNFNVEPAKESVTLYANPAPAENYKKPTETKPDSGLVKNIEEIKRTLPAALPRPSAPIVNDDAQTTARPVVPDTKPVAVLLPPAAKPAPSVESGKKMRTGEIDFDETAPAKTERDSKRPERIVDTPPSLGDKISTVSPAVPLNPLGYATPETKKPEPPALRYAPPQYRSYIPPAYNLPQSSEEYARVNDNTFRDTGVLENRLSTFSADVDTAAYSNVRRFLNQGQLPPADAVRIEEMVNYFKYDYTAPKDGKPFHVFMELAQCPWNPNHKLARIGIKAAEIEKNQRPASNLVFLIDVSGSMDESKRLPLVKKGLISLVENLNENDRVAIVTYASGTTLALRSTSCNQKDTIVSAIENLRAGGSTNGGDGIQRAYEQAGQNFIRGGVNRVILATDGDFNVGITDQAQLTELIEAKAKSGVFLTVLGYGMGNLKDAKLELLADKGNGHYAYIDTDAESRRVLVDQLSGTLVTVAKDVKFQVEFNPSRVRAHRLVGYENRILEHADFNNDAKDAGEIGAGHIVTALYEIVPTRESVALPGTDPLRYQPAEADTPTQAEELLMLKIRYKLHNQDTSNLLEFPILDTATTYAKASRDFKFSAAVAGFGMLLRGSPYRGNSTFESVLELSGECVNGVPERKEFIELVQKARELRR